MKTTSNSLEELRKALYEQRKAFDSFIAPEREHLWRFCRRLTGSLWDGEDLVQETLIRAFGGLSQVWSPTAPRAYLFRIATRLWIDRQRQAALEELPLAEEVAVVDEEPLASEKALEALEALSWLPPRQRVVLLLTQAFDFTARETAEMLDVSEGAIKAMLRRARVSLRMESVEPKLKSEDPVLFHAFVDAFNRRDVEALSALFHEDVRIQIVGMGEERGREDLKNSSVKYTVEDKDANEAAIIQHLGEPAIALFKHLDDGRKALSEVIRVEARDGEIIQLRTYYFCPQVLEEVAQAMNISSYPHGYYLTG